MKAVVLTKYGSPEGLTITDISTPIPGNNEVLVKIHATTVTAADTEVRRFKIQPLFWLPLRLVMGLFKPKKNLILGQEFSGEIVDTGSNVSNFQKGDLVFGSGGIKMACQAELKIQNEHSAIVHKPSGISFDEASTIPLGGLNALHYLRKGKINNNDKVLIIGAGGAIGTYAVQYAKYVGAHVTAIDTGIKLDMLKAIGADEVIDFNKEDFWLSKKRYSLIFDVASKTGYSKCISALSESGRFIPADYSLTLMLRGFLTSLFTDKKVIVTLAGDNKEDLMYMANLINEGQIKPVIGKTFSLEEIPEANRLIESNQKLGCFVVRVQ
ncbi:NAD(P)-dependent alcohol dehydrogenase [Marinigracilibium pacificum]|uniref:NAD(P)-dependent alcohol dehydrogenase n=1 Tax=Marinigracilibium pacificum TaxID=2729599 RepID=A0A848IXA2_9BACT|nr:NAD(P)-dependent alcohol dehydrogenase [Marinigracilibium pacificum]NMM47798.1 NAD(P)-dependent alcohol dehydrogenase [Marinigracilibium pacificum]